MYELYRSRVDPSTPFKKTITRFLFFYQFNTRKELRSFFKCFLGFGFDSVQVNSTELITFFRYHSLSKFKMVPNQNNPGTLDNFVYGGVT